MIQQLIQVLKSGYGYDRNNEDGTLERILVAPNKYMISAAKEIERLMYHLNTITHSLEMERARVAELEGQAVKYRKTITGLEDAAKRNVPDNSSDSACTTAG